MVFIGGVGVGKGLNDSSVPTEQEYMIGLTQEPFDTNDEGGTDGRRDGQSEI